MEVGRTAMENMAVKGTSKFWKGRRVLVTGGAGFIGYALATKLAEDGARVCVLDIKSSLPAHAVTARDMRKKITFVRGSVTSKKTVVSVLKRYKIQTIFDLAAEAIVDRAHADPSTALETNIKGTWVLFEAARALGVSEIVKASSDKAYGSHDKLPYKEDAALKGVHPYDCSKSCADLIAQMYAHTFAMPVVIARCGNVYGPGDTNWSRLIPDAFRSAASGATLEIRSDGTFKRDYVYVWDAVNAYMTLA
jgi:CDP-glucose 4,6-dehydratase